MFMREFIVRSAQQRAKPARVAVKYCYLVLLESVVLSLLLLLCV